MADEPNNEEMQSNEIDPADLAPSIDELLGDYDDIESIINLLDSGKDKNASEEDQEGEEAASGAAKDKSSAKKLSAEEKKAAKLKAKEEKRQEKERAKEAKRAEKERKKYESQSKKEEKTKTKEQAKEIAKEEEQAVAEAAAILQDTGSTSEDMADVQMAEPTEAEMLLSELENLENLDDLDKGIRSAEIDPAELEREEKKRQKKEEKEAKKKAKAEQKKAKKALKKEEKERKKREKPKKVKEPREYVPEEKIKVSAVGIVFIFTIVFVVVFGVYFGATYYHYNDQVKKASQYYMDKDYDKAYDLLSGMSLKKNDEGLYNQVFNIMQVKKHISDFEAFLTAEKYASALEALLRGIESYDENIMAANELGTTEALGEVLGDIVADLQTYYGINMDEARNILLNEGRARSAVINERAASIVIPEEPESEQTQVQEQSDQPAE